MPSLLTKTRHVSGVISLKDKDDATIKSVLELLREYLGKESSAYGCILHDKDVNDDGSLKTPHIHLVAEMNSSKRLSTWLNALSTATGVGVLAISVERFTSFEGVFQYLIHKNEVEKFHYKKEDILTNIDADEVDRYLSATASGIDFDTWCNVCVTAESILEVIDRIGVTYYQKYRATILDIYQFVKTNKVRGADLLKNDEESEDELP